MITSNAPQNYVCPICLAIKGIENEDTLMKQADLVYKDELVSAWISAFFIGKNAGHVVIVPNEHIEAIYTLPFEVGHRVFDVAKRIALAMKKAYACDGITTRQNNEPAGDQHAFHFHFHVFPRYKDDNHSYIIAQPSEKRLGSPKERAAYADKLKAAL